MEPNKLSLAQIKWALRQRRLPTQGRKADLIKRIQEADPTGEWMDEAIRYGTGEENTEDEGEDVNGRTTIDDPEDREANLIRRERELLRRENELLRLENERASPGSSASTNSRTTTSIKSISAGGRI